MKDKQINKRTIERLRYGIIGFAVMLMMSIVFVSTASAATLDVPSTLYPTIQDAIDAASSGDIIIVAAGTYGENPNIDKKVILRGAYYNEDPAGSTDRGSESIITGQVQFTSTGDEAELNGFKLSGHQILINGADYATVSYNIVADSSTHGIYIGTSSPNAQVLYNTVSSPAWQGISNQGNSDVTISHNYITGVDIQQPIESTSHTGTNIEITHNVISDCTNAKGINYWGAPGAVISYNTNFRQPFIFHKKSTIFASKPLGQ